MDPAAYCFLASSIIRGRASMEFPSFPPVNPKSEPQMAGYFPVIALTLSLSWERRFGKLCCPESVPFPETAHRVFSSARASGVALGFTGSQAYLGGAAGLPGAAGVACEEIPAPGGTACTGALWA